MPESYKIEELQKEAIKNVAVNDVKAKDVQSNKQDSVSTGIELPGFIRKQTTNLKRSLSKDKTFKNKIGRAHV